MQEGGAGYLVATQALGDGRGDDAEGGGEGDIGVGGAGSGLEGGFGSEGGVFVVIEEVAGVWGETEGRMRGGGVEGGGGAVKGTAAGEEVLREPNL